MTTTTTYAITPEAAAALVPRDGTILVETASRNDPEFEPVRAAAIRIAAASQARLVLYDSAAESYFTDPYPSGPWTADVDGPNGDRPLTDVEIRDLGRNALAWQMASMCGSGGAALAWLPRGVGAPAMAAATRQSRASLVIRASGSNSLKRRLTRRTNAAYRSAVPAPIVTVDSTGAVLIEQVSCRTSWAPSFVAHPGLVGGAPR